MKPLFKMLAVLTILVASVSAYAVEGTDFGPYEGKVVDADTKEPIEGVVVLVEWRQIHTGNTSLIDAQETLTDGIGQFYLLGIRVFSPWKRTYSDARMIIYKSGYKHISAGAWKKWAQLNPSLGYVLKIEDEKPVFILKKLTMEERKEYGAPGTSDIPHQKKRLLINEINKELRVLGYGAITD